MTVSVTASLSFSMVISGACWVETTIAGQESTSPFSPYSTVTWHLPSGRRKSSSPFFLTSASLLARAWAMVMGAGINSGVSSQA